MLLDTFPTVSDTFFVKSFGVSELVIVFTKLVAKLSVLSNVFSLVINIPSTA